MPLLSQATRTISAVPRSEKQFISAMRIWISAVGVSCCDTLTESFEAPHLRLDATAGLVSDPSFPEGPAVVVRDPAGFVAGDCGGAALLPRTPVLVDRDNRDAVAVNDGGMAAAGVIGAVGAHCAYGDLVEQRRQDRAVTLTAGREFHGQMSEVTVSIARCSLSH